MERGSCLSRNSEFIGGLHNQLVAQPGPDLFGFVFIRKPNRVCLFPENLHLEKNDKDILQGSAYDVHENFFTFSAEMSENACCHIKTSI